MPDYLATDLAAFLAEHERSGELDTGMTDTTVWVTCSCGARMERPMDYVRGERR